MRNLFGHGDKKTWNGMRWMFVLLAAVFGFITARLIIMDDFPGEARILLLIPASFCVGCLLAAIFAQDRLLQKVAALF